MDGCDDAHIGTADRRGTMNIPEDMDTVGGPAIPDEPEIPGIISFVFADEPDEVQFVLGEAMHAGSMMLIDELFDSLDIMASEPEPDAGTLDVLCELPVVWWDRITPLHARKLLVSAVQLTTRLLGNGEAPASLAESLLFDIVADNMKLWIALTDGVVPDDWPDRLDDGYLEDTDHRMLKEPELDGVDVGEIGDKLGIAPLGFDNLFTAFRDEPPVHEFLSL